ncbi:MAG: molybdopterin-synthase adenylyltransferase MoeB [Thermomicrobiales bacterium]
MPTTYRDLLEKTRSEITNITNEQAERLRREGVPFIDVRELDEVEQGIIKGANYIPRSYLESRIENVAPDKHAPLVVYCAGGARSAFAIKALEELGYTNALNLDGGFNSWKISNLPWHVPKSFTPEQRRRYSRHFLLPEVGEEGQRKLLDTKVLMIGAGGLGSPAALYLAAAGIGTIGIVDDDLVDDSNMQRQVAHTTDRIGMPKVESAKIAIQAINPDVHVNTYQFRLSKENVLDLFADYDIIYDGTDNFASRYLINDACVLLDKPNIHGSIFRFEGQATVFHPPAGPCYRCLFPDPPPPELAPNCAEAGVLGVLPGTIGLIQATETIKIALGIGESLVGRLLAYDALYQEFRELKLDRDPACPMCGENRPASLDDIEYTDVGCLIPAFASAAD